jgi:hypothetical protein
MKKTLLFIHTLALSSSAFGHGHITNSRSKLCFQGTNHIHGAVQYEPQSKNNKLDLFDFLRLKSQMA